MPSFSRGQPHDGALPCPACYLERGADEFCALLHTFDSQPILFGRYLICKAQSVISDLKDKLFIAMAESD
jgi:hypothetical protein